MKNKMWVKILVAIFILFVAIQFYPYGRDHENPPITNVVNWDSPETKDMFYKACADCHSNETNWPWYSHVAPTSWLVQSDVEEGRSHFNISDAEKMKHADEAGEMVEKDAMPLPIYVPLHPEAKFTESQKAKFVSGLNATFSKAVKSNEQEN